MRRFRRGLHRAAVRRDRRLPLRARALPIQWESSEIDSMCRLAKPVPRACRRRRYQLLRQRIASPDILQVPRPIPAALAAFDAAAQNFVADRPCRHEIATTHRRGPPGAEIVRADCIQSCRWFDRRSLLPPPYPPPLAGEGRVGASLGNHAGTATALGISFVSLASAVADFVASVSIMRSFANRFTGELARTKPQLRPVPKTRRRRDKPGDASSD